MRGGALCAAENVFVQVSLDGTVRSSGLGVPPWQKFVGELAPPPGAPPRPRNCSGSESGRMVPHP